MDEFTVRGSGLVGLDWDPIRYSWPYPARRGAARRRVRKPRQWKLLSSITGRIDVYLKRGRMEAPDRGAAGWFADNLGLFTKQTEEYSVKEFLRRYAKFLSAIRHRNVLLLEIDYENVCADKANKGPNNLDDALARAYKYLASRGEANKVLFSTFRRTNNGLKNSLEITLEAQYNRKHGHGKPAIEIRILGIPSILIKKPREEDSDHKARTKRLFRQLGNAGKEKLANRYENTAKILIRNYEHHMYKFFNVAKTTRWLHIGWGKTREDLKPRTKF